MNDSTPFPGAAQAKSQQLEVLLRRTIDLIDAARPMPLSASSMINKDEVLELLNAALAQLPEEMRAARWLLKERDEFLARVRREGDEILDAGRARAEQMVQRTEVVKAANHRARQIVETAEMEARRLRHETEDYCDQRLGRFEIVLQKTMEQVQQGRSRLQGHPLSELESEASEQEPAEDPEALEEGQAFFDQDDSPRE